MTITMPKNAMFFPFFFQKNSVWSYPIARTELPGNGGTPYEVKAFLKNSENIFGIIYKDLSCYHRCPNI